MKKQELKYLTAKLIDEEGLDAQTAFYKVIATKKELASPSNKPPKQSTGGGATPAYWERLSYNEQMQRQRGAPANSAIKLYPLKKRKKKGRLSKTKGRVKSALTERALGRVAQRMDRIANQLPLDKFQKLAESHGRQVYDTGKGLLMKANSAQAMYINSMEGKFGDLSARVVDNGNGYVILEKLRTEDSIKNKILDRITDFAIKHASKKVKVSELSGVFAQIDETMGSNLSELINIIGEKSLNEVVQMFSNDNWGMDREGMMKMVNVGELLSDRKVPPKFKEAFEEIQDKEKAQRKLQELIANPPKHFGEKFLTMDRSKITPEYLEQRTKSVVKYLSGFMDVLDPGRSKMEFVSGRMKKIVSKKSIDKKSVSTTSWFNDLSYNEQIKYIKSLKSPKAKAKWAAKLKKQRTAKNPVKKKPRTKVVIDSHPPKRPEKPLKNPNLFTLEQKENSEFKLIEDKLDPHSLQILGSGVGRRVLDLGNDTVLKIARNPGGIMQNQADAIGIKGLSARVLEEGDNYIIQERLIIDEGVSSTMVQELFMIMDLADNDIGFTRKNKPLVELLQTVGGDYGVNLLGLLDFDINTDMFKPDAWGVTNDGDLRLIDGGCLIKDLFKYEGEGYPPEYEKRFDNIENEVHHRS